MRATLTKSLTYHVVAGKVTASDLVTQNKASGGMAKLKTVEGSTITARMDGEKVVLADDKGGISTVEQADVMKSNGAAHVIDTVLMPGSQTISYMARDGRARACLWNYDVAEKQVGVTDLR